MKYWDKYTKLVKRNCAGSGEVKDLAYWRNNLFSSTIIYLLPFCFIALLPSLYLVFLTGQYSIALVDLFAVILMLIVAFMPGIILTARKVIFISCFYIFSCAMLYYIGLGGPGLLFLLAACLLSILIFPTTYIYWPAWMNTIICILFGIAQLFNLLPWLRREDHPVNLWIAVSANLIFISFLLSALIPRLFAGLQHTLDKEQRLKEQLNKEQRSLEQALSMLQQKNMELEQFAYVASHDLNEPIRMISSFMGLLKDRYGEQLDEKANTYIDYAVDGGKRMQKMISDLLELSRTGRKDSEKETVNLQEILEEVKLNIFKLIEETHAEIITTTALPVILFSRTDIIRLIQNLVSNAIKFRRKETIPIIKLSVTDGQSSWLFSIQDNGIGIDKAKFQKIFEVFTRLHLKEEYEGTGIGLAICKKIAEQNGGEIWVESEEGQGSTFCFTIKK